jgi:small conductance mechanosensitive channel
MENAADLLSRTDYLNDYVIPWGINIVMALAILVIGRWIARGITRGVRRLLEKAGMDAILTRFLGSITNAALLAVVAIAALNQLGVDTTSVLAVFAAAGLAVGLALKDSLSNFSAGVMLIFYKPFKLGDFIEAAGTTGVVEEIGIFNTVLKTPDNREVTVPNAQIYGGIITNVTARDTRRVDLVFGIGYEDKIPEAKAAIQKVLEADVRILAEPAPFVAVVELADSSVNIAVRPWVKTSDWWQTRCDLTERVKEAFDARGISIPFPQRDVHLYEAAPAQATPQAKTAAA